MLNDGFFFQTSLINSGRLNYFYKISLRIPTILVRDFSRFEVVINYDEVGKRFFLDFLRFGGERGFCARGPYFHTHGRKSGGAWKDGVAPTASLDSRRRSEKAKVVEKS